MILVGLCCVVRKVIYFYFIMLLFLNDMVFFKDIKVLFWGVLIRYIKYLIKVVFIFVFLKR